MKLPPNIAVLTEPDNLDYWLGRLGGRGRLASDTETTGLRWDRDRVGGLCLAANDTAVYATKNALDHAIVWMGDQVKRGRDLVFHNGKYDLHMMRGTFGLNVMYPVHDTMIMSFLVDNRGVGPRRDGRGSHKLKDLAGEFLDPAAKHFEDECYNAVVAAGGSRGKDTWKADILLAPPKIVGRYGAMDAWYTLQLADHFLERLRHTEQPDLDDDYEYPSLMSLYETERWLLLALRDMEHTGIRVNSKFLGLWQEELEVEMTQVMKDLEEAAGTTVNWNSTPQLRSLLYETLGLPIKRWTQEKKGRRSKKKFVPQPSTDEVALLDLNHPIGAELLRYRNVKKQLGTYAKGLLNSVWDDDRIHATFKQMGARTGRLSCEDPNLQQVPRGSGARKAFVPDSGLVLRFADYSQVEMRFAAHFSNDPTLVAGFLHDAEFDTHAATAKKMWGLSTEPAKEQRKFAKIMNFAMLYGAGENKITSQLISMLSSKEAGHAVRSLGHRPAPGESLHRSLAQLLMKRYFEEFPAIKSARYRAQKNAEARGYTVNAFGRRRYLDDNESYKAFNSEIQGSAADQAKLGLVDIYREMQIRDGSVAMLLQIHDEVVYLSDGDPKTDRQVLELLNDTRRFRVPIVADVSGSSTNWQEKVDIMKLAA